MEDTIYNNSDMLMEEYGIEVKTESHPVYNIYISKVYKDGKEVSGTRTTSDSYMMSRFKCIQDYIAWEKRNESKF